ncbi:MULTISPECIES: 23S rRNA (pseudouridine(1915)-N(3))-methyltransferase RlmH [unclassified Helicobacter]|uniref:23S rRNA (pseudouridine(1915)-N(3))-methyltransferase RlmH n=1 Tax=unclassified Helicobacter TaxID=2593540 RepID=UPI000CF14535|nr:MULTISPECIES: 23S rRNA (pseudouridine(1915)-N(3))-methyltransferase RlmH [unclassified Helicobacter]
MRINLYCIAKDQKEDELILHYQKLCRQFNAELKIFNIFNSEILKSQKKIKKEAMAAYTKALLPYLNQGSNVILHPKAKMIDSFEFSKILQDSVVSFFIGGAYGFEEEFLKRGRVLSLSSLTFAHKVAKIVLCEQIYRGLSLLNHHPYHK